MALIIAQSAFITHACAENQNITIDEYIIETQSEDAKNMSDTVTPLNDTPDSFVGINKQSENYVEVNSPSALQDALNGDAAIIKIVPPNNEDCIYLNKSLEIYKDRIVSIIADRPVSIIGASGQWQFITGGENQGHNIIIQFSNVILDGRGASGGIYNRGTLRLDNARIQNCYHTNGGVGIYSIDSLTVENSVFENNYVETSSTSDGGGIYARGLRSRCTVNIINTSFINNMARYGGAVRIDNADISIADCDFTGNTAVQGSCIYIADLSDAAVSRCTLERNTGSGALFVNTSSAAVTNSSISNNNGRGIYAYAFRRDAIVNVNGGNMVISGNAAKTSYGGGIIGYSEEGGRSVINIGDNARVISNEAVNGGGVSGFPGSNVVINISGNAQIWE